MYHFSSSADTDLKLGAFFMNVITGTEEKRLYDILISARTSQISATLVLHV